MYLLDDYFSVLGIHLVRSPTYSPELNAIEKLFGYLKCMVSMETFLVVAIPKVPQRCIREWSEWTRNCIFHIEFD
jgi:hypothetical protein